MGDIFADQTIAAGEGAAEVAVFVADGDIEAVNFKFAEVFEFCVGDDALEAFFKCLEFAEFEDVLEGEFAGLVGDLREFAA